jgi:hypothetical protein
MLSTLIDPWLLYPLITSLKGWKYLRIGRAGTISWGDKLKDDVMAVYFRMGGRNPDGWRPPENAMVMKLHPQPDRGCLRDGSSTGWRAPQWYGAHRYLVR